MQRRGAKSFVDDLVLSRGVVLSRAATTLRSIETKPFDWKICPLRTGNIFLLLCRSLSVKSNDSSYLRWVQSGFTDVIWWPTTTEVSKIFFGRSMVGHTAQFSDNFWTLYGDRHLVVESAYSVPYTVNAACQFRDRFLSV